MRTGRIAVANVLLIGLAACDRGNVNATADYNPPPPPPIQHPNYDPYAPYGQVNATWQPPVANREENIIKPAEPASEWDRPNYEATPWATGALRSQYGGPPGTF